MADYNLMNLLRRYQRSILIFTVAGFIISTFVGFGLYIGTGAHTGDTVLEINGEKVPYYEYLERYNRIVSRVRDSGQTISKEEDQKIKQQVQQSLIQDAIFSKEAELYAIHVSDKELLGFLASVPAFQKDGQFDVPTYAKFLRYQLKTTPEKFEEEQRQQMEVNRLRGFIASSVKVTDPELQMKFQQSLVGLTVAERKKKIKEFEKNPGPVYDQLVQQKVSEVLSQWYQQLGSGVQVKSYLDKIRKAS